MSYYQQPPTSYQQPLQQSQGYPTTYDQQQQQQQWEYQPSQQYVNAYPPPTGTPANMAPQLTQQPNTNARSHWGAMKGAVLGGEFHEQVFPTQQSCQTVNTPFVPQPYQNAEPSYLPATTLYGTSEPFNNASASSQSYSTQPYPQSYPAPSTYQGEPYQTFYASVNNAPPPSYSQPQYTYNPPPQQVAPLYQDPNLNWTQQSSLPYNSPAFVPTAPYSVPPSNPAPAPTQTFVPQYQSQPQLVSGAEPQKSSSFSGLRAMLASVGNDPSVAPAQPIQAPPTMTNQPLKQKRKLFVDCVGFRACNFLFLNI